VKSEQEDILDEQGRLVFTMELAAIIVVMRYRTTKTWERTRRKLSP
jgi:hypothetical protein